MSVFHHQTNRGTLGDAADLNQGEHDHDKSDQVDYVRMVGDLLHDADLVQKGSLCDCVRVP